MLPLPPPPKKGPCLNRSPGLPFKKILHFLRSSCPLGFLGLVHDKTLLFSLLICVAWLVRCVLHSLLEMNYGGSLFPGNSSYFFGKFAGLKKGEFPGISLEVFPRYYSLTFHASLRESKE